MSDTVELLGFRRCSPTSGDRSHFPLARSSTSKRRLYRRGFCLTARLSVGDREPRADREGGELIDRVAARTPVRELFLIQPLGHAREPFARVRADHRAGIKPAAIDTHRAAEAAADLERGLNDGVASRRGTTGSKYVTFRGGLRWAIPFLLVRSGREISVLYGMPL